MKALNRKSSSTSLQMTSEQMCSNESSRGSVPPEQKIVTSSSSSSKGARAKSVSKEPAPRDDSQNGSLSRFFSLSRRIAKIRFSSSSQPPPPLKSPLQSDDLQDSSANNMNKTSLNGVHKTQSTQLLSVPSQDEDTSNKKNVRERALSPSKFLNKLRPRSPFGRTSRNSAAPKVENSDSQSLATTSVTPNTKNKSFTVSATNSPVVDGSSHLSRGYGLMSASYHSESMNSNNNLDEIIPSSPNNRLTRATTAVPTSLADRSGLNEDINSLSTDKLRSLSCEFIDNQSSMMTNNMKTNKMIFGFKELNETLDENDESYADNNSILTASSYSNAPNSESQNMKHQPQIKSIKKVYSLSTGTGSKVEALRKNFMESANNANHEIVKSVKFKEPPEKNEQTNSNDSPTDSVSLNESSSNVNSENGKKLNVKFDDKSGASSTNEKPPKGPLLTNAPLITVSGFNLRNKFTAGKSRTIDFPDLLQNAMVGDSSSSSPSSQQKSNGTLLTSNGKPIQSILRRSETPPSTRSTNLRQTSIESNHSTRETSIEKLLKQTSSTSRPLMFNN
jgi:hypothetical protein